MENSFKNIIDGSKSILILLPTKPFFDQVAAGLSLYLALRDQKDVQISSPTPMTVEFNRLIGVNRISQELGNKNLVMRFTDYRASDIERVSYDIENSQFRLTVIPKQKVPPPTKEQVELSYSGISADTVIIIGGANESHFPAISTKELAGANILHIGTRDISLSSNKSYISFSRPASSVSEVVASLLKESSIKVEDDVATNLLMGIEEASNNFTDPSVTAETFGIVAELMRSGGKRSGSQVAAKPTDFPPGAIPGQILRPQPFVQPQPQVQSQPQTQSQSQPVQKVQPVKILEESQTQEEKSEEPEEPPKDWLSPKIYKGTSIS